MNPKEHWETVYRTKMPAEVSWFQPDAITSMELIAGTGIAPGDAIIDIGGGASTLVDGLVGAGYTNVTVLDIASAALDAARARLGPAAEHVHWIPADVLAHTFADGSVDVWHDRAAFHFLTAPEDRRRYVEQVLQAVRPNGHVIIATFAEDGPARCSGLDVCRYNPEALGAEFGAAFELVAHVREEHLTPAGANQMFQYCLFRVRPAQIAAGPLPVSNPQERKPRA